MTPRAFWPAACGLVLAAGCTPGPITPRSADDKMMGGGGSSGSGVSVVGRDGAAPAETTLGRGGAGGAGAANATSPDAGTPADGAPAENPKLPRVDAAVDGATVDAPPAAPVARAPRPGEVVIDELLVNPTGDDLGREWIEIVSLAAEPLDLSQLHLATASTDVAVAAGTAAPGALLLLGQSIDPSKNGGASVAVGYGTKLILVNADGQLSLCLGACATGVVIDAVSWGALGDAYTGHALVVDPATKSFCAAGTPFGTGGSFGTPGAPNTPCLENVDGGPQADVSVAD
jgi:hypothetical protein